MPITNLDQATQLNKVKYELFGKAQEEFNRQRQEAFNQRRPPSLLQPSMERAVRPFLFIDSQPPAAPAQKELLPGEDTEAFISWGRSSTFIRPPTDPIVSAPGDTIYNNLSINLKTNDPRRNDDQEPNQARDVVMQEEARKTKTVRIYDPDDSAVYIEVARITEITFRNSENGRRYVFKINDWSE